MMGDFLISLTSVPKALENGLKVAIALGRGETLGKQCLEGNEKSGPNAECKAHATRFLDAEGFTPLQI